jgi:hypothetical protein
LDVVDFDLPRRPVVDFGYILGADPNAGIGGHRMAFRTAGFLFYGLWTLLVIVGLIIQTIPVFLIVMMLALAVGFPPGTALTVIPVAFVGMLYLAFVVASKLTRR